MSTFDFLWQLVANHGGVAENYKTELARVWAEYSLEEQRFIYRSIRDKLRADKFVNSGECPQSKTAASAFFRGVLQTIRNDRGKRRMGAKVSAGETNNNLH